jgi:hypothetical protein
MESLREMRDKLLGRLYAPFESAFMLFLALLAALAALAAGLGLCK